MKTKTCSSKSNQPVSLDSFSLFAVPSCWKVTGILMMALYYVGLAMPSQAQTIYWTGTSNTWNSTTDWSTASGATTPNPATVPGAANDVVFNITTVNGAETITLDAAQAVRTLTFNNTGATTLTGSSGGTTDETLTLNNSSATSPSGITVASGAGAVTFGNGSSGSNVLFNLTGGSEVWTNNSSNAFTINDTVSAFTRSTGATLSFNQASTGAFNINTTSLGNTNGIIGPWSFYGTGTSTKYAVNNSGTIVGLTGTAAATGANLTDTTGTVNYDLAAGGGTVPATVSANTIRYTGAAGTTAPGATSFTVNGLLNAGTGLWTIGTNALTIGANKELVVNTANADININAAIKDNAGGASSLTKTGSGTLTIAGQTTAGNEFTGTLYIDQGTVNIGAVSGTQVGLTGGIVDNGNLILNGFAAGSNTVSSAISGVGSVTLSGTNGYAGIILGTNNTFSGGLTVNSNAQLRLSSDGSLGATGGGVTLNGGQVRFTAAGAVISSARTITLGSSGGVLDTNGNSNSFGGTITGSGSLAKIGTGTLTLSSANSYTGYTSITNGTLTTSNASALGTGQVALGATGGTAAILNLNGTALTVGSLANALGTVTLTGGSGYSISTPFTITGGGGSGAAAYYGGASTVAISNGGTGYTSAPTFSGGGGTGGTFTVAIGGGSVTLGTGGALTLAGTNSSAASFNGVISGAGSVTKQGTGTQIFSGANTYTGATTVNSGTLQVDGSLASGSAVSVLANVVSGTAVLSGSGTVSGAITLGSASAAAGSTSIIAPGTIGTIGTLTTSSVSVASGSSVGSTAFDFDINTTLATSDLLKVSGLLSLGSGLSTLNLNDIGSNATLTAGTVLSLAQFGTISGTFAGLADGSDFTLGANTYQINYGSLASYSNYLTLEAVAAVPETSTYLWLCLGLSLPLLLRLKKQAVNLALDSE